MREELKAAIHKLLDQPDIDSPVYRFLPKLRAWNAGVAPILEAAVAEAAQPAAEAAQPVAPAAAVAGDDSSIAELMETFHEAKKESEWSSAARALRKLIDKRPNDPYFQQQLALVTYKSRKPDPVAALNAAKEILQKLLPHTSTDPETLGLWGAVHKRLYELTGETTALDESIWAYEKGFYVRNDHYNGINLAFVLNLRAANAADPEEATADVVQARRVRRRVADITRKLLAAGIKDDEGRVDAEETFWVQASLAEALVEFNELVRSMFVDHVQSTGATNAAAHRGPSPYARMTCVSVAHGAPPASPSPSLRSGCRRELEKHQIQALSAVAGYSVTTYRTTSGTAQVVSKILQSSQRHQLY